VTISVSLHNDLDSNMFQIKITSDNEHELLYKSVTARLGVVLSYVLSYAADTHWCSYRRCVYIVSISIARFLAFLSVDLYIVNIHYYY
jgi:hypothetical protein